MYWSCFLTIFCIIHYLALTAAGVSTAPLLAEYGAAKSYIAMFSRTLNVELAKSKIHVQCQVMQPIYVLAFILLFFCVGYIKVQDSAPDALKSPL